MPSIPDCTEAWPVRMITSVSGSGTIANGTLAVTTLEDSLSLYAAEWQSPLAWVFGAGLSPHPARVMARASRLAVARGVRSMGISL